jgi:predicted ATP-grasp superfamily ATP-dependent carboligase
MNSGTVLSNRSILVTDGYWRKTLAIVRSLGKEGISLSVGERTSLAPTFFSRYVSRRIIYPSPKKCPEEFLSFLLDIVKNRRFDLILTPEEFTSILVARHRKAFEPYVAVPLPSAEVLELASDKLRLLKHAAGIGIRCPKTYYPKNNQDLHAVADDIGFPAVIKPRHGTGAYGIRYVKNESELLEQYPIICKRFSRPMIQEFIPGKQRVFGVSLLFNNDLAPRAYFVHRKVREFPVQGGVSTFRESVEFPYLVDLSVELLKSLKWYGIANIEFKLDPRDGKPKLMELNPRFWGSLHLAIRAGVNFPYLLYRMVTEGDVSPVFHSRIGVRCRWLLYGDLLYFLSQLRQKRWDWDFFRFLEPNTSLEIINWDDPLPFFGTLLSWLAFPFDQSLVKNIFH